MAITIQEIADLAGVSRGTVDRALNNRGRVNQEVATRILEIAEEHGYQTSKRKRKNSKPCKIGVITQLDSSSFMLQVHNGLRDAIEELQDKGIEVILRGSDKIDADEQEQYIDEMEEMGVQGLAIMPVDSENIRRKLNYLIEDKGIKVITFNSDIVGTKRACFVGLDNKRSGHTAAGLMGLMTQGRGKVLVITGYFSNSANGQRVDGFIEEMKQSYPEMELLGVQSSSDDAGEVEKIIINTMTAMPDVVGIFVASGGQAGVKKAFEQFPDKKRPYVIIYDLTPKNVKTLKDGNVDFLIDQEGYMQGYKPLAMLADMILKDSKIEQEYEYTRIMIITKHNVVS